MSQSVRSTGQKDPSKPRAKYMIWRKRSDSMPIGQLCNKPLCWMKGGANIDIYIYF